MNARLASVALALIALALVSVAQADPQTAAANAATADLAHRLNLPVEKIRVASIQPQVFPDTSLGLSKPDAMYAQMLVSGYVLTLSAARTLYLYTATDRALRYGGSVGAWGLSALYLQPVPDEPNLNANLMQISLAGTNAKLLLEGVTAFWAQPDGSVLAKRRTSRSGHDLFYLAPGQTEAKRLLSTFDLSAAAISKDGSRWCAFTRPGVGGGWQFTTGPLAGTATALALPADSRPQSLWWNQDNPVILVTQADKSAYYELLPGEGGGTWRKMGSFYPPENSQFQLNKSEALVIEPALVEGKPVTRVSRRWFTGDDNPVVTISDFTVRHATLPPYQRFALLTGVRGDHTVGLTVDIVTGEVMETVGETQGNVQLLCAPPQARLINEILGKMRQAPVEE